MLVCEEKDGEDERIESGILSNVGECSIIWLYRGLQKVNLCEKRFG